ncbi:Ferritin, chloroplastic-like protein [Drosera capensis]
MRGSPHLFFQVPETRIKMIAGRLKLLSLDEVSSAIGPWATLNQLEGPTNLRFFKESSDEGREHVEKLMKYQNTRGGRVKLYSVDKMQYGLVFVLLNIPIRSS